MIRGPLGRLSLQRGLWLWLIASSALAFYWPRLAGDSLADPFLLTKPWIQGIVAATMFFLGWMLPAKQVDDVIRRGHLVAMGTALQYLSMPLLAWALCGVFDLQGSSRVGMLLVGAVPGAMASNVLTLNAGGNVSYSVSLTTSATLLSPLLVPLVLSLTLGRSAEIDVVRTLTLTVVLPVITGHLLRRRAPKWNRYADRVGPVAANLTILWIIAIVVAANRERLAAASVGLLAPLLTLNVAGYLAGYGGGAAMGLDEGMRRALTLEIGMQNAGVGTMLAVSLFDDPATALPPAIYTFACMLTGTLLARWWGRGA